MKRFLVTILSILYMASAMGATVHIHYCMGKMVGASLTEDHQHQCSRCGMKKTAQKKGCCKDEHRTLKTSDHQYAKATFTIAHKLIALPQQVCYRPVYSTSYRLHSKPCSAYHPADSPRTVPIYLRVRSIRV